MPYRVFNLEEVAVYLHLPAADVRQLVHRREIPFHEQGTRLQFRKKDIDAWASHRILSLKRDKLAAYHRTTSAKAHDLSQQHAIMPELMRANCIAPAMGSKTKASVLRDLVKLADQTGLLCSSKDLLESLEERERMCSTALPGGIALVHPRHHEPFMFEDSFIILGKTIQPIPFGSPDGSTTDLFFLVCCQDDSIHLHVLARICMLCHHTSLVLELREAQVADEMREIIIRAEEEVIQQL